MNERFAMKLAAGSFLIALAGPVAAADDPPLGPAAVTKVTVTPSSDPFQSGSISIDADINPSGVVLPRAPKTGEDLELKGRQLHRVVKLEAGQLAEWQK